MAHARTNDEAQGQAQDTEGEQEEVAEHEAHNPRWHEVQVPVPVHALLALEAAREGVVHRCHVSLSHEGQGHVKEGRDRGVTLLGDTLAGRGDAGSRGADCQPQPLAAITGYSRARGRRGIVLELLDEIPFKL